MIKNFFLITAKYRSVESINYQGPGYGILDLDGLPKQPGPREGRKRHGALNRPPKPPKREYPKSKGFDLASNDYSPKT